MDAAILVLLWSIVVVQLRSVHRGAKQRALWLIFLMQALAKTVVLAPVATWTHAATARADAPVLLHHLFGVGGTAALLWFVALITGHTRKRRARRLLLAVFVTVALVVLFTLSPTAISLDATEHVVNGRISAVTAAYWLLLEAYLGSALVIATVLLWRTSRKSTTPLLRLGLRIIGTGTLLNALVAPIKITYVVQQAIGSETVDATIATWAGLLLTVAIALVVVGTALPAGAAAYQLFRSARTVRALMPLWRLIQREFPDVVLKSARTSRLSLTAFKDSRLRLYRQIIEIRDGMLELRAYAAAGVMDAARLFVAEQQTAQLQADALAEACWIAAAVAQRRLGAPPASRAGGMVPGGASIDDEAAWLSQVSQALHRSPVPATFAATWIRTPIASAAG